MTKAAKISLIPVFMICAACLGLWIYSIVTYITMPQMEYSEGLIMYLGKLFGSGQWEWGLGDSAPFLVSFYPPVYYYLLGWLMNIFGDSLIVGRALVLATTAVCCIFVYLIIRQVTGNKMISIISGLLPLTHPVILGWSFIVRVDIAAVMFELMGIYLLLRFRDRFPWLLLSIPCFLLAVYTKQSIVAGSLAAIIWLLVRNWRQGLIYTGVMCAAGGVGLLAATVATDGEFFNQVFLYQRTNPTFKHFADDFILVGITPLAAYIALSLIFIWRNKRHLLSIFMLISLPLSILLVYRLGSSHVYFVEAIMATCLAASMGLQQVIRREAYPLLIMFVIPVMFLVSQAVNPIFPDQSYRGRYDAVKEIISDADYPILTENVQVALDAGKVPYYEPFVFSNLADFGYWDEQSLIDDLTAQRIDYIVSEKPYPRYENRRVSLEVQQAVMKYYEICFQTNYTDPKREKESYNFVVYKPKN